jgi:Flp pilus assembly protein TadG
MGTENYCNDAKESISLGVKPAHGQRERGAVIIETALSMVVLLTVIFGVLEVSLAVYNYHFLSYAAREGTRYAIVRGSSCNSFAAACPNATAADVSTYVKGLGFPGIYGTITVTTTWPTTGSACTPNATPCDNPGNLVKVVVSDLLPFAPPFVPAQTVTMTSTSEMVISQ